MKKFKYTTHSANRVRQRGLSDEIINYYRKNNLLVKSFDDDNEHHFLAYIEEQSAYYLFVINKKTNELVTCMELKYASRSRTVSQHLKIEAYNLTMSPNNHFESLDYKSVL
jgi:hypothetical protein